MTMMMGTRKTGGEAHLDGEVDEFGSCGARMMSRLEDHWGRIGAGGYGG